MTNEEAIKELSWRRDQALQQVEDWRKIYADLATDVQRYADALSRGIDAIVTLEVDE